MRTALFGMSDPQKHQLKGRMFYYWAKQQWAATQCNRHISGVILYFCKITLVYRHRAKALALGCLHF